MLNDMGMRKTEIIMEDRQLIYATWALVLATIILTFVSWYSDKATAQENASRQFIYNYSRTFFDNPKYRNISVALESQYLSGNKSIPRWKFSDYEMDDFYNLVSDFWSYYQDNFISKDLLGQQYSYEFCVIYNAQETKDYRGQLVKEGFSDDYSFLDDIAKEFDLIGANCKTLD